MASEDRRWSVGTAALGDSNFQSAGDRYATLTPALQLALEGLLDALHQERDPYQDVQSWT